ncbi:MAG: GTPase ObgE [Candidatus Omnitrophica bacterium]|nr:GTPase ObgE [Candidatus Omnitrophota bacterium]
MIFVDEAKVHVKAGRGGKGCESFYRTKFMRYPRPDGGDGGRGGNVIFVADKKLQTLQDLRFQQNYQAHNGYHASSKGKTGRSGEDCLIRVPVGTILRDPENGLLIRDLSTDKETVLVAKGGTGGLGNFKHKYLTSPAEGEERYIDVELKLIADVGIVGFPNAGKSTIISNISKVKSKIGNYHFTTRQPILGIVYSGEFDFIVADLPGIIEGAHLGKGLGDRFLRHAERTKILLHVIDMAGSEGRDPLDDYKIINKELKAYSSELDFKYRIIVANKMDLPEAEPNLKKFKKKYKDKIFAVSALNNEGLPELVLHMKDILWKENLAGKSGE